MTSTEAAGGLRIFTTCPPSALAYTGTGMRRLQQIANWSEAAGCEGILVFTDNSQLDPWLVSQAIITGTKRLCPLVAVQPAYMHPYTVAKLITTMASLHGRRVHLNMVAGGFKNDLEALDDRTPHDDRYLRLVEYTTIIQRLVASREPLTFEGRYYRVKNLRLTPPLAETLRPDVFVSGSSESGMAAARELGAVAVEYPKPAGEYAGTRADRQRSGLRIGIIARERDAKAWAMARARFPEDRKGQLAHQLAMQVSDSRWHRQMSTLATTAGSGEHPYWLVPFQNYKAMCPYLVGSYDRVADELIRYVESGFRTFILDEPASADEIKHTGVTFERVMARCAAA
ncbi:MAG TPA: LLM class flavin-dependent oxidoreductase [Steroidobacteraceae bacterium]